ncbi:DUF2851 family protein [candidate division KSB1 bacterium]|nr:DUF2851 family protein [candidate division KSB1 bacterium]
MKLFDGMTIPEEWIAILWEKNYFQSANLKSKHHDLIIIISTGFKNLDSGPDFKDIAIKTGNEILQGDLEIHRTVNDWYLHGHQHDAAYNNVILHLIFGEPHSDLVPLRQNETPVPIQIFIDIPDQEIIHFIRRTKRSDYSASSLFRCHISHLDQGTKLAILDQAGLERLIVKSRRFADLRLFFSWNQIIYMGFMESLGYSKNQGAFLKLAKMVPYETIQSEFTQNTEPNAIVIQALLFGAAGLLPSQDKNSSSPEIQQHKFIETLEQFWHDMNARIGFTPMHRSAWRFFRLRPNNFPTRRIAGASYILERFIHVGILDRCVRLMQSIVEKRHRLIQELEALFICPAIGFWADHYLLSPQNDHPVVNSTLIGKDRAVDIITNIIIPGVHAYAEEAEDTMLMLYSIELFKHCSSQSSNSIIREMIKTLGIQDTKSIKTALRQQGLIHLYKSYCRRGECDLCVKEIEGYGT